MGKFILIFEKRFWKKKIKKKIKNFFTKLLEHGEIYFNFWEESKSTKHVNKIQQKYFSNFYDLQQ